MADFSGVNESVGRLFEGLRSGARTVSSAYLAGYRGALVPTGVCPVCRLRVPVLRTGQPVRHWPHKLVRKVRLVPARDGWMTMVTVCAGSEVEQAGMIMVEQR